LDHGTASRHHPPVRDLGPLSTNLDHADAWPYFLWDEPVTVAELRQWLRHPDRATRALWTARVMREARYPDVWRFIELGQVLDLWPLLERHLGRSRAFWTFLIEGWRSDGLLPESA